MNSGAVHVEWRGDDTLLAVEVYPGDRLDYLLVTGRDGRRESFERHDAERDDILRAVERIAPPPGV